MSRGCEQQSPFREDISCVFSLEPTAPSCLFISHSGIPLNILFRSQVRPEILLPSGLLDAVRDGREGKDKEPMNDTNISSDMESRVALLSPLWDSESG